MEAKTLQKEGNYEFKTYYIGAGMFVGGKPVPLPSITFENSYTLKVGSQELRLEYKGDDHESGNIYIYAPKQKVLMKVDVVFPGWTPFKGLAIA